jgi:hypothetical protein
MSPDLVQAFLKKWWVESYFKALNLPLSLRLKGSGCHYNNINNKIGKIVVKAVPNIQNHDCNMNAFFSFDLFMIYIPEYKQQLRTMK